MNIGEGIREEETLVPCTILGMRDRYREHRETSVLDAVTAALSLDTIRNADAIDPQMREAFEIANPQHDLSGYLNNLDFENAKSVSGAMSNWRGKYFEILVRDELKSGGQVGDLVLGEGQTVELAEKLNQPGWDLQVFSESGETVSEYQLKAVKAVHDIKTAIETNPNIEVITTLEVAERISNPLVMSSGIANEDLKADMTDTVNAVVDSPLVDALEMFGQGLPVIMIVGTEGAMWIMGRRTFATAFSSSVNRAVKTGMAMTAGVVVAASGAGMLSLPTVFATRLAFTRYDVFNQLSEQIDADIEHLRMLKCGESKRS